MPVSLLTPIARDLGVTEGLAGQGIAISGALSVLTSLTLSTLAGNVNLKYRASVYANALMYWDINAVIQFNIIYVMRTNGMAPIF